MTPSEHLIQASFFELCRLFEVQDPRLKNVFSIPNGGLRNKAVAAKLKKEGLQAGVLDVFCMVPSGRFNGLWVEFKRKGGRLTKEQVSFAMRATAAGYPVIVATDPEDAFRALKKYLNRPEFFEERLA